MRPRPAADHVGQDELRAQHQPATLTSMVAHQSSRSTSQRGPIGPTMPAPLTSTSKGPSCCGAGHRCAEGAGHGRRRRRMARPAGASMRRPTRRARRPSGPADRRGRRRRRRPGRRLGRSLSLPGDEGPDTVEPAVPGERRRRLRSGVVGGHGHGVPPGGGWAATVPVSGGARPWSVAAALVGARGLG